MDERKYEVENPSNVQLCYSKYTGIILDTAVKRVIMDLYGDSSKCEKCRMGLLKLLTHREPKIIDRKYYTRLCGPL